jgi:hypothetical protein
MKLKIILLKWKLSPGEITIMPKEKNSKIQDSMKYFKGVVNI